MWTRNYKNCIQTLASVLNQGASGVSPNTFGENYLFNFKDPSGTVREIGTYSTSNGGIVTHCGLAYRSTGNAFSTQLSVITDQTSVMSSFSYPYTIFIGLGSSGDIETELDYALGEQISNIEQLSAKGTPTLNDDGTLTIDCQVVVSATADVSIREIGMFEQAIAYAGTKTARYMLINRIVLDEPISVASGEVANVTFSVTTPKISFS